VFKGQSATKSTVKRTWSDRMTDEKEEAELRAKDGSEAKKRQKKRDHKLRTIKKKEK